VLLLNAPAVDLRLPWARWHQPTGLLQIGAALRQRGCDVRFLDCLLPDPTRLPPRTRVGRVDVEGHSLNLWRFGISWPGLANYIRSLRQAGWSPDLILVSCLTTSWWQGAQRLVQCLKAGLDGRPPLLLGVPVILGGAYPSLAPEHAARHSGADLVVVGSIPEARDQLPAFDLYAGQPLPRFSGVYLYHSQAVLDTGAEATIAPRPPDEVAAEVAAKAALGVVDFAFFDQEILPSQRDHFVAVLDAVARRALMIRLLALGNLSPRLIDATVAHAMRRAGYRQVYLKCDVTLTPHGPRYETCYDEYRSCVAVLHQHVGLRPRTDKLAAMQIIGVPYEGIECLTERVIRLASIVGSVNLVPWQVSPGTATSWLYHSLVYPDGAPPDLAALNCKLYPLARRSGIPYDYYVELTRLAALLNTKYHSTTFDFLGHSLVARAAQASLADRAWQPTGAIAQLPSHSAVAVTPLTLPDWSCNEVLQGESL
jgi:hypothetical protein